MDETALVETSEIGGGFGKESKMEDFGKNVNNKRNVGQEERRRRRGKGGKNKHLGADEKEKDFDLGLTHNCEIGSLRGSDERGEKRVYTTKELEALRFVELEGQKKIWAEVYCGLGPAVQKEYDVLLGCNNQNQCHHQQPKKHLRVNFNHRFRNEALPSILGEESSETTDNEIAYGNRIDPTSGLLSVNEENDCLIEQGECKDDDSDEDYNSIQKPAFCVTGEPDFESGPPEDGLEYLRRVRWEASQIPKVKVAKVDRSKLKEQTSYMPQIPDVAKCPVHLMPLKEWEDSFLADFSELKLALSRFEVSKAQSHSSSSVLKEESSSKLFESILLGNFDNTLVVEGFCQSMRCSIPENRGNPHSSPVANENHGSDPIEGSSSKLFVSGASGKCPTLSTILRMDPVGRVSMLRKRICLAETTSNLSWDDCLWLFVLSAAVDSPLDADTSAAFRALLRKCASLRAEKLELDEEVAMLNILATISGRFFGQLEN